MEGCLPCRDWECQCSQALVWECAPCVLARPSMLVTVSRCPLLAYQLHHPPLALIVNLSLRNFLRSFVLLLSLSKPVLVGRREAGS